MKHRPILTKSHQLDNNANIFPVVANKRFTNVFRVTAVMRDVVDPVLLQKALEATLPYFAAFHVRLRHGLFWNYLETNRATPHVQPETESPCRYIDPVQTERYLFRLLYFDNRIHLETFHVLTDGTGALRFLRAICYSYCKLLYPAAFTPEQHAIPYGTEHAANIEDGYVKSYIPVEARTYKEPLAFHIHGDKRMVGDVGVVSLLFSAAQLKEVCRTHGVSIGVYLTAALACGVYEEYTCGNGSKRPLNIYVPVDLRRYFDSQTSLNFFSNLLVSLSLDAPGVGFDEILEQVKAQFAAQCTKEQLAQKISYTARAALNLAARIAPLPLKNSIMRIIYEQSNRSSTLPFSNLGAAAVEPFFSPYFDGFRLLMSPTPHEPIKVSAISLGDKVALSFCSLLESNVLARNVAHRLAQAGVAVQVESNECEKGVRLSL